MEVVNGGAVFEVGILRGLGQDIGLRCAGAKDSLHRGDREAFSHEKL